MTADSTLPPTTQCGHWSGAESRYCRAREVRQYVIGHRCPAHTPNALAGRPETPAGPGWPTAEQAPQEAQR